MGNFNLFAEFTKTYEMILSDSERGDKEFIWEIPQTNPYNEAIVSWNGLRPKEGKWTIYLSLHQHEWSPWLKYAEWTPLSQCTFKSDGIFAETFQDGANPKSGTCDAIRVQVVAEGGADLKNLDSLYVCLSHLPEHKITAPSPLSSVLLSDFSTHSQMLLDHPRFKDMCSPTSTTNAIKTLFPLAHLDPICFASRSHDDVFDIYGNWILNTAEAYEYVQETYRVHVERLGSFEDLHKHLSAEVPVVVSVKGSIPGAPQPYNSGHLICVIGYEAPFVYCVDPAFADNRQTFVKYLIDDFLKAWGLRRNIAYVFTKK